MVPLVVGPIGPCLAIPVSEPRPVLRVRVPAFRAAFPAVARRVRAPLARGPAWPPQPQRSAPRAAGSYGHEVAAPSRAAGAQRRDPALLFPRAWSPPRAARRAPQPACQAASGHLQSVPQRLRTAARGPPRFPWSRAARRPSRPDRAQLVPADPGPPPGPDVAGRIEAGSSARPPRKSVGLEVVALSQIRKSRFVPGCHRCPVACCASSEDPRSSHRASGLDQLSMHPGPWRRRRSFAARALDPPRTTSWSRRCSRASPCRRSRSRCAPASATAR